MALSTCNEKKREGLVENLLKRTISWEVILPMMIWAHVM